MTIHTLNSLRRPSLSKREIEVLILWLASDSKQQAAQRLFLGESTVHTHVARIRDKYRVAGRPAPTKIALLIRAIEDRICTLEEIADHCGLNSGIDGGETPGRIAPHVGLPATPRAGQIPVDSNRIRDTFAQRTTHRVPLTAADTQSLPKPVDAVTTPNTTESTAQCATFTGS